MFQIIYNKLLNHSYITYYDDAFKTKLAKVAIKYLYFQSFESQKLKCEEIEQRGFNRRKACFKICNLRL